MNISCSTVISQQSTEIKKLAPTSTKNNVNSTTTGSTIYSCTKSGTDMVEISSESLLSIENTTYNCSTSKLRSPTAFTFSKTYRQLDQSRNESEQFFYSFYRGEVSASDIKQRLQAHFLSDKQTEQTFSELTGLSGQSDKDVLRGVVGYFTRFGAGWIANSAMNEEGAKLADEYGGSQDHNWRYYNADFYYKSQEFEKALSSAIDEVLAENNMTNIDKTSLYPKDKDKFSFNRLWNQTSANVFQSQEFSIKDTSLAPPKGFKLFYKDKQYSQADLSNGTVYCLSASDKLATGDANGSVSWYITVPKGRSLLKAGSFLDYLPLRRNERTGGTYNAPIIDLDGFLYRDGYTPRTLIKRFNDFVQENFNNFENGILIVGDNNFEKRIDIPYRIADSDGPNLKDYNYINYGTLAPTDTSMCNEYNTFMQNFNLNLLR